MTSRAAKSALYQLSELKHTLESERRVQQQEQARRAKAEAEALEQQKAHDPDLFRQAMHGIKPLHDQPTPYQKVNRPKPDAQALARRAAAQGSDEVDQQGLSDIQALLQPVASEAFLSFRQATLQHRLFDQLKAGKMRWYEAVDLHGCTIEQARLAVLQVIDMAQQNNQTVVKIVHGKGPQATLKTCVNGWLRQHRDVLAFVSAPPEQGGTGAVLVLLKRPQPLKTT